MRTILVPATLAAIIAGTPLALAAQQTTGIVRSYDIRTMVLELDDGGAYQFSKGFRNPGLKAGDKVTVSWDMKNGKHMASAVKITS